MGAALSACSGHADDQGLQGLRLDKPLRRKSRAVDDAHFQTQSRAETRELLSDEEREAMRSNLVRLASMNHSSSQYPHHPHTESEENEYLSRQQSLKDGWRMNQATVEAFRSKLREPIMSPRSKLMFLGQNASTDSMDSDGQDGLDETYSDDMKRRRSDSAVYEVDPAEENNTVEEEEEYFEFIRIIVPPGPCGVVFQMPTDPSMPPTVDGFVRMYDGAKGPIENSSLVKRGSILCAINDLDVTRLPLTEVIRALNLSSHLEREFVFRK
ncbi:hypothetical protein Poli38472_002923 [Pythium oligandrum]|uniref:PDZ domain-containing protein n=1 Tax=Pythium oligandrum TaxID=41045 RepID=A0A8K1FFN9_PYTOL|nr:hypothetical protein Poli38472_002923 [Pythium oligandrum]|eukprot:TMW56998.1 hypothetical protein Poli38472_002923 [Pythium oligandrum]